MVLSTLTPMLHADSTMVRIGQYHALSLATSLNIYLNRKYVTLRATLPVFISVVTRLKADSPGRIRA